MNPARLATSALLLAGAALAAACDRAPPGPPTDPRPGAAAGARLEAADASCRLPLRHFGRSSLRVRGSVLDHPMNRVIVDRAGRLLWNGERVQLRVLERAIEAQARATPPVLLVVTPLPDAPCAAVREALALALRAGRCRPDRCVFEWPGTDAPPDPPRAFKGEDHAEEP